MPAETWEVDSWGAAPWDPMTAEGSVSGWVAPVLVDASGAEVAVRELVAPSGEVYAWAPADDLEPGSYSVEAPGDPSSAVDLEVEPFGTAAAFDVSNLAGRVWQLDPTTGVMGTPPGVTELLLSLVTGLWLTVESVDEDTVIFDIVAETDDAGQCRVLRAEGTVDEQGQLWWSKSELEAQTEPTPTALSGLFLHGGVTEDGGAWGGVEGGMTVETTGLDAALNADGGTPMETCPMVSGFGAVCYDCAGLGDTCLDLIFHAAVLDEVSSDTFDLEALPSCGGDVSGIDGPTFDFDCEFSGFTCAGLSFGLMGAVGWRRRRRDPGEEPARKES